ncbi:MAG: hypothetical protein M3Q73_04170 [bacterium]|nr:hypothetical protein [bacterium]
MSKDMLGPVTRALVGVPQDRLAIIADIGNRLAVANGDDFHSNLTDFLRNGSSAKPAPLPTPTLTVWREVTAYPVESPEAMTVAQLTDAGFHVNDWAKDIMGKPSFKTLTEPKKFKLARCKVRDLGFKKQPTTDEIWARIQEVGGELCPPELGLALRKDFADQPVGDYFWLAMKQITDSYGDPRVFGVGRRRGGGRWLDGGYAFPGRRWGLDGEVVFVLRQ